MFITELNDDELILIFKYCSELDHNNLSKVCKLFENIIEEHFNEAKCRSLLMVSHKKKYPEIFERTFNETMKYGERLRIHKNWVFGSCQQFVYFQHRENFRTLMQLDSNFLYTANLGEFNVFQRNKTDGIKVTPTFKIGNINDSLINSLKRKYDIVGGVASDGSLFTYSAHEGFSSELIRERNQKIINFDFHEDIFVTTSDFDSRFHRLTTELGMQTFDTIDMKIEAQNLKNIDFDPSGKKLLGTSQNEFYLIDACNGRTIENLINTSHIYKTQWINDSSFLFTSRNNPLSLIDTRQGFTTQNFSCGNFTATCIDYDGLYGIVYGTLLGMMILCDIRNPNTFERVFHLDTNTVCREIITDEMHLFVSTDNAIHMLNFNV